MPKFYKPKESAKCEQDLAPPKLIRQVAYYRPEPQIVEPEPQIVEPEPRVDNLAAVSDRLSAFSDSLSELQRIAEEKDQQHEDMLRKVNEQHQIELEKLKAEAYRIQDSRNVQAKPENVETQNVETQKKEIKAKIAKNIKLIKSLRKKKQEDILNKKLTNLSRGKTASAV